MACSNAQRILVGGLLFLELVAHSWSALAANPQASFPPPFAGPIDNPDAHTRAFFWSGMKVAANGGGSAPSLTNYVCNDFKGDASRTLVFTWGAAGLTSWKAGPVKPGWCLVLTRGITEVERDPDAKLTYTTQNKELTAGAYRPKRNSLEKAIDSVSTKLQFGDLSLSPSGGTFVTISTLIDSKSRRTSHTIMTGPGVRKGLLALPRKLSNSDVEDILKQFSRSAGGEVVSVEDAVKWLRSPEGEVSRVRAWLMRAGSNRVLVIEKTTGTFNVSWASSRQPDTLQELPFLLVDDSQHPVAGFDFLTSAEGD